LNWLIRTLSVRENGADFQAATHGPHEMAQGADVHVAPALHLGDCGLTHVEHFREMLLGQIARRPEFVQGQFLQHDLARASALARASGDILARSSSNFLAMFFLLSQLLEVRIVEPIRDGYVDCIPSVIARLVAANQKDCRSPRIK
jgi:hypothetical protein